MLLLRANSCLDDDLQFTDGPVQNGFRDWIFPTEIHLGTVSQQDRHRLVSPVEIALFRGPNSGLGSGGAPVRISAALEQKFEQIVSAVEHCPSE